MSFEYVYAITSLVFINVKYLHYLHDKKHRYN